MTPPAGYTEDALVEQPAIALLAELGWETVNAYHEFDPSTGSEHRYGASTLGRETRAEVILKARLRLALLKINPEVAVESIHQAIEELTRDRSRLSMAAANREIYHLLKNGVRVAMPDPEGDGETVEVVQVVDWEDPANNDFLLCSQFWVTGEMHTRRADLVGFVNGLPLVFIELKAAHRRLESAFSGNLRDYKDTIPQLFWPNALIILSNGSQSRVGSVSAGWEHFAEWKKVGSEDEAGRVSLETMLRGVCDPARLLDLVENFSLFQEVPGGLIKLTAKNHQYLGVNNAIAALADIRQREGKLGVFWHTQGSGKSVSMIFFAQKVLRKLPGNWTFVVVTDRQELDGQIYKNFASAGVVSEGRAQAESSRHLRQLLTEDHRSIATEGYVIREPSAPYGDEHWIDLSQIDFEALAEKFKTGRKRTLNERLKGTVAQKLMALVRLNRTRMDYLERFQALIDAYNAGSLNAEEFFQQLLAFAKSLNEEEQRGVGEQLNEEELALFDLLTRPQIELSNADREKVKATVRELLATLKAGKLVLDWRKRQQARAEVRVTIEKLLDQRLPRAYTPELFEQKTTAVFQHVYEAYYGAGRSVYAAA